VSRRLLVLAYKFPDLVTPGGSTRVEKFVKYLPRHGWEPLVLSVKLPSGAPVEEVHRGRRVVRTASSYATAVRAYRTRYIEMVPEWRRSLIEIVRRLKNLLFVPDDALMWWPAALPAALRIIRKERPDALFVSGPPFSGLLLGALLRRITGVPFVADLRDDWAGNPLAGPRNSMQALSERPFERLALGSADAILHVTQASLDLYRQRYRRMVMRLVPNGFDEEEFPEIPPADRRPGRLQLLHLGSLKEGNSPAPLLRAMELLSKRDARYRGIRVRFVGTTHREHVGPGSALNGQVEWLDRVPRREALRLMGESDGLVLLPFRNAPTHIPGKTYEYLRSGRPLLVVSEPHETARFLSRFEGPVVHAPGDVQGIAGTLAEWYDRGPPPAVNAEEVSRFSRERLTGELADVLGEVACGS
jgi:glycosyltransferase involved in cell wall biosynthesis